jgi:prenyltransferase beta subunit
MKYYPVWQSPNWWWHMPRLPMAQKAITFIQSCQNEDGGFSNWPNQYSYMECCFHAMVTLNILDSVALIDRDGIYRFMMSRLNDDGGFGDEPGHPSTIFNTFYATVCLNILQKIENIDSQKCLSYFRKRQKKDGGFGELHEPVADMITTFWSSVSLYLLRGNLEDIDHKALANFITGSRYSRGGYGSGPGNKVFIEYTFEGMFLSKLLFLDDKDHNEKTVDFILSCQSLDNRFGEHNCAPPTMADTAWAISALSMLQQINRINVFKTIESLSQIPIKSLWHYFCILTSLLYLIPQDIFIKVRKSELTLQRLRVDEVMVDFRPLRSRGTLRLTPDIMSIERATLEEIKDDIQQVDQVISELSREGKDPYHVDFRKDLGRIGRQLTRIAFSKRKGGLFNSSEHCFFVVAFDPSLIGIPWELMHDGDNFICLKHAISKEVISDFVIAPDIPADFPDRIKVLIIGNPKGKFSRGLQAAEDEAQKIYEMLQSNPLFEVTKLSGQDASRRSLRDLVDRKKYFHVIHFAGHAYFDDSNPLKSGWIMSDGKIEASILERYFEDQPPKLVFVNACTSAAGVLFSKSDFFEFKLYGMAQSFLKIGSCYIGSYWPLFDQPGTQFAILFYRFLSNGYPVSEALRRARVSLYNQLSGKGLTWASYTLFGDYHMRLAPFQFDFRY